MNSHGSQDQTASGGWLLYGQIFSDFVSLFGIDSYSEPLCDGCSKAPQPLF